MRIDKALLRKIDFGETIIINNQVMRVLVAPRNRQDFDRYLSEYKEKQFGDETAYDFCSDDEYKVCGFWTECGEVKYRDFDK